MYTLHYKKSDIVAETPEEAVELSRLIRKRLNEEKMAEYERQSRAWVAPMHQPVHAEF